MSPQTPSTPPTLLTADELQERLAARTTASLVMLGRIAQRVVEEEAGRRLAGKPSAGPELLVERAMRLVAAAVPVIAPPTSDDEPFALASEAPALSLDGETPFATEPPAKEPAQPPTETPPQLSNLDAFPDQPQRRWVRGALWLVAGGAALLAVAAGIIYVSGNFPRTIVSSQEPSSAAGGGAAPAAPPESLAVVTEPTALPSSVPAAVPTMAPATPTPAPTVTATPLPSRPARTTSATAQDASLPEPVPALRGGQTRAGVFATADWRGAPFFAIHFSSYRDHAAAEADARTLSARHGLAAKVLTADLGAEGVWYRVMLGEFDDEAEALRMRNELAARGTPDLGYVFKVIGKR